MGRADPPAGRALGRRSYGRAEVDSWYWEVWNEPDIGYWQGTPEEYQRLYDYAADGLKRALPSARIGGPHVTGPRRRGRRQFLRSFLEHCAARHQLRDRQDRLAAGLHRLPREGRAARVDGHVRMGISNQLRAIANGFEIVASFPELKDIPIVIGESDPEGCAACSVRTNPENAYRNGTMYSSYTAEQIARTYELADRHGVNLLGAVTWAFEFEDQPYFAGFRDLATNGIDKPVLNVFRMLGRMARQSGRGREQRRAAAGRRARCAASATARRLRARQPRRAAIAVLLWNYHDDDLPARAADIDLTIDGIPDGSVGLTHDRIDADHSNAYEAWKRMGQPQPPSAEQVLALKDGRSTPGARDAADDAGNRRTDCPDFTLPRQGVSLVTLELVTAADPPASSLQRRDLAPQSSQVGQDLVELLSVPVVARHVDRAVRVQHRRLDLTQIVEAPFVRAGGELADVDPKRPELVCLQRVATDQIHVVFDRLAIHLGTAVVEPHQHGVDPDERRRRR